MKGRVVLTKIMGIPYAQEKHRGRVAGCAEWSDAIRFATRHLEPILGPCKVNVVFRLPPSKFPSDHPYGMDLDNLMKRLLDALHETVFRKVPGRDGCVMELRAKKIRVASDAEAGADLEILPLPSSRATASVRGAMMPREKRQRFATVEAYKGAFSLLEEDLPPRHRLMLKAHYQAPARTVTARELAAHAGYAHYGAANMQYGALARKVCSILGQRLRYHVLVLVEFATPEHGPDLELRWIMRPEVAQALEELHWV